MRLIELLKKDFKDWPAFNAGIINEKGSLLRLPTNKEQSEFYGLQSEVARRLRAQLDLKNLNSAKEIIESAIRFFNIPHESQQELYSMLEMVAGDSGGSAENIASGTTTGDIILSPTTLPAKRKKRKK
ncbi:hypothetical protein KNT64_gp064 [Pseudomonas phage PspYZU05]|uniref:Uncharacterized protein n=1 Tax=Pseudomonas phage PspYZU05 TaxID=1983556 RepID=A0A2U7N508_9CAUD|nr:hypothetical protein KNT64_gp064 [Pseudomonas phage PspYZU05]ASD52016.1 hypothetical protein PspYZU05_64 [Pseudomonas phage PspYZU05]